MKNRPSASIRKITVVGMTAAVISVMAQISIPMPSGIPMTLQTFAITLAALVLGAKLSFLSVLVYVLLGTVGLPVFANFTGGFGKIAGPTGGFLISFPIMAFIIGLGTDCGKRIVGMRIIMLVAGTCVNYAAGTVMFCFYTHCDAAAAISACVLPFIPSALIQAVMAFIAGPRLRKRLLAAGVL